MTLQTGRDMSFKTLTCHYVFQASPRNPSAVEIWAAEVYIQKSLQLLGLRIQGLGFRVAGLGFRV